MYKRYATINKLIIVTSIVELNGGGHWLRVSDRGKVRSHRKGTFCSSERFPSHVSFSKSVPYESSRLWGNVINWDGGIVPYNLLESVLRETVNRYAHLFSYGATKCPFLSGLLHRPVLNLEDFGCPNLHKLGSGYSCVLPCHGFSDIICATSNAHSF